MLQLLASRCLAILAACLLVVSARGQAPEQNELIFVIRIDDILSRNVTEPRDLRSIEQVAEARGARLSWAVIPHRLIESQNEDGKLASELSATTARGHEIVLHGYVHICEHCGQSSHEMYCTRNAHAFDYDEQYQLIAEGHRLLVEQTGTVPRAFVPPGHAYDATTLDVLADRGYDVLSVPGTHAAFLHRTVFNIEPTREYTWALSETNYQSALAAALADITAAPGYFQLLLHDPFTRPGYLDGITLRWMGELLDSVNAEFGGTVRYETLSGAADYLQSLETAVEIEPLPPIARASAYPNPARDVLAFRLPAPTVHDGLITVVNPVGKLITTWTVPAGATSPEFDIAGLSAGVYLYRLEQGAFVQTGTFTVVR
jgi:predicted deacetylase